MRVLLLLIVTAAAALPQAADTSADLESDYLRMLAKWSGNSENAVRGWRQRVAAYNEVAPMLYISRAANVPPLDLVKQRDRGMTWGEIARDRKVRVIATDVLDETNLFVLAQHYRRPLEEVRGMRRPDMSFLQLTQELQRRAEKPPSGARRDTGK